MSVRVSVWIAILFIRRPVFLTFFSSRIASVNLKANHIVLDFDHKSRFELKGLAVNTKLTARK